jgi:hypothetical protein
MLPNKVDKLSSKLANKNNNHNNIPYPNQVDKDQSKDKNDNTYVINELKEIQELHQQKINSYKKGDICKIIYSEEEYKNDNRYLTYDKLLDLIYVKEPYDKNKFKNFKYKNYEPDNELFFSSDFESGNLRYAIKINSNEYDLLLRPETNCLRTYHWFFFRVSINELSSSNHLKGNKIVKFNIINLYKRTVLFSEKARILCYYNNGWSRDTFNIHYFINGIPYQNDSNSNNNYNDSNKNVTNENINKVKAFINNNINIGNNNINAINSNNYADTDKNDINNNQEGMKYHTLTFSFDLDKITTSEKYIYFAYCYPYSFSQLDLYLSSLNHYKDILRFDEIGKSIEGKSLHMLIITNFNDSFDELANKKAIIFTGRIHPGESNGSYVVQGVIEFLLSNDPAAKNLRKNFIFKIVPMLNPDGVVHGNFRMNCLGKDLNRMWDEPDEKICPTIYNTLKMIKKTEESRDIYFFCDFHGHSNKHNFFLYSCKSKFEYLHLDENTIIQNPQKMKLTYYELVFQFILNKENTFLDRFSCVNKILPSKTKTSRAILKTKYNVDFSYCLETSIASMKTKEGNVIPYTINQYKKIGKDFCISLNKLIEPKIFFSVLSTVRFSKNEKCSLYSKSKAKAKGLLLPYINNITSNTNNNISSSMNGTSNATKGNSNTNKKNNNYNKNGNTSNNHNHNNYINNNYHNNNKIDNKVNINNYFHKLNGKIVNNNVNNNNKGLIKTSKNFGISNSASTKDNSKNHSFKYNNIRRSFEIYKHS